MKKIIIFELILMVFSVFIFRALWAFLDRCPWLSTDVGLVVSFGIGVLGSVWALGQVNRCLGK